MTGMLSPRDAAARLGLSEGRLRRRLREGTLAGEKTVDGWRIPADAVAQLVADREARPSLADLLERLDERLTEVLAALARVERLVREQADPPDDPPERRST